MKVSQAMQSKITTIAPDGSVRAAAALMQAMDVGMLPVCENGRAVGVVTDRDIVLRLMTKTGAMVDVPVREIMSGTIIGCGPDESIETAAARMGDHQIRRLIVQDDDGRMVGIMSLSDIARDISEEIAGQALGEIVEHR